MDFLTNPFIVALLFLYSVFGGSLLLAIVIFTVATRLLTFPLTQAQLKSTKKMQEIAPLLKQIKEDYKGDREKQAQAQMELYRQAGVNPFAGCLPLVIQMPILFGLYGAIYSALGTTPLQLIDLQQRLMIPDLSKMIPLQTKFLWLDLGQPDPLLILPILVVVTTWLQMKLTMPPSADPKDPSAAMSRNMMLIMPMMIGMFSLSFASGLSIYWVLSNVLGIGQYALMGRIDFRNFRGKVAETPAPASSEALAAIRKKIAPAPATSAASPGKSASSGAAPAAAPKPGVKRKLSESKAGQAARAGKPKR